MTVSVSHTDHSRTEHPGDPLPCPLCGRAPLLDIRKVRPHGGGMGQSVGLTRPQPTHEIVCFCACEDHTGVVGPSVRRGGDDESLLVASVLATWDDLVRPSVPH